MEELKEKLMKVILDELNKLDKDKEISLDERLKRTDYLYNISKILSNYKDLEPILKKYFSDRMHKRRMNISDSWDTISK